MALVGERGIGRGGRGWVEVGSAAFAQVAMGEQDSECVFKCVCVCMYVELNRLYVSLW